MKKLWYSKGAKILAVVLFMTSLTLGLLWGLQGAEELYKEEGYIYDFGSSLENSYYFQSLLEAPENAVLGVFRTYMYNYRYPSEDSAFTVLPYDRQGQIPMDAITQNTLTYQLRRALDNFYYKDKVLYYVNWQGRIFTNASVEDPQILCMEENYRYLSFRASGALLSLDTSQGVHRVNVIDTEVMEQFQNPGELVICTAISPEILPRTREAWDRQEQLLYTTGAQLLCCVLTALLCLIYLLCVCGRNAQGEPLSCWVDNIWVEVHLFFLGGFLVGGTLLIAWLADLAFSEEFPIDGVYLAAALCMPLVSGMVLSSLLSMIRNIKLGMFAKRSGILLLLKAVLRLIRNIFAWIYRKLRGLAQSFRGLFRRSYNSLQVFLFLIYTLMVVLWTCIAFSSYNEGLIFLLLLPLAGGIVYLVRRGKELQQIKDGATRIRQGELNYKIPPVQETDLRGLQGDLNDIAQGLNESVAAKVKAERMKTELITNVSHDLKTPLTSIISYTELLSKTENLPEEARDYIRIIASKSDRLKQLTQDLFDISKVQSGNEELLLEKLDTSLLIQQAMGELDREIEETGLEFCIKTQPELYISADGRKLSRVLGNLIQNTLKYSMKHTRVFLSAMQEGDRVVLECKNISSYPMDFTEEEIIGRFVRGDRSRSTEGSGLGLAIAKSYTELCGGEFRVILDGDLFKVRLSFPPVE